MNITFWEIIERYTMDSKYKNFNGTYQIKIKGIISHYTIAWYDELKIDIQENGETVLTGYFPDQSALRGLLEQLWNLNYIVLSVERIENEHTI